MRQEEHWSSAISWVEGHSRMICGYVRNHHLLDYSAYELQDFLAEAYLAAYDALSTCANSPFEAYFWVLFKNKCKILANKPHKTRFVSADISQQLPKSIDYNEETIEQCLLILTPKQRAAFTEPEAQNISRQALQQRINTAIKTILAFRQAVND